MTERKTAQTSGVPRGLLQFLVLKLLTKKAMSGAEIVEEIEQETSGFWKPSPGSIYPLLARLQDKGYTYESLLGEGGMKRYILTDEGTAFFKRQVVFGHKFLTKLEYLVPILLGGFHFNTNHEHLRVVGESAKRLVKIFIDARATIKDSLTQQDAEHIAHILNNCAKQLENIAQSIKEKKPA
jgi:DNA-binding PadR family transcriptional regulator